MFCMAVMQHRLATVMQIFIQITNQLCSSLCIGSSWDRLHETAQYVSAQMATDARLEAQRTMWIETGGETGVACFYTLHTQPLYRPCAGPGLSVPSMPLHNRPRSFKQSSSCSPFWVCRP